jgi:hypothetical protein
MFNLCTVKVLRIHRNANSLLLDATPYFELSWFRIRAAVSSNPCPDYITLVCCMRDLLVSSLKTSLLAYAKAVSLHSSTRSHSSRRSPEAGRARGCCCKSSSSHLNHSKHWTIAPLSPTTATSSASTPTSTITTTIAATARTARRHKGHSKGSQDRIGTAR